LGSAPDLAGEAHISPQTPYSCISGVLLLRKRRGKRRQGEGEEKNKRNVSGKGKEGNQTRSPIHVSDYATDKKDGERQRKATERKG